ncbi:hypothetical protein GCK72_020676 [Caenorhabditis remanei]|uniref:Uncharacterized protein n=1 Tax=Caenorhabditis remanei TaxID=31234 RepID=A0A2P4VBS3_CAERE|nr:hypothetical protein GCK72_020676 [Caenorhabditis remanei]KAF1754118.1 hypothetical protein GCK72_020676 [Caenorhabditis remanei]
MDDFRFGLPSFLNIIDGNKTEMINITLSEEGNSTKYLSFRLSPYSRLGNHIFELSALLGVSRLLKRTPLFYMNSKWSPKMLKATKDAIPGIFKHIVVVNDTVPPKARSTFFNERCCVYEDPRILLSIDDQYLHLTGIYFQSYKYFQGMRKELTSYLKEANISNLPESDKNTFVTCLHIRRGDFLKYGLAASDAVSTKTALEFIEKREEKSKKSRKVTIIFGDDLNFMKSVYNDSVTSNEQQGQSATHFISQNSPSDDLVYSKNNCDVVFISAPHSTFGWWMGYFSKGDKVYYMDIRATNDKSYITGDLHELDYYLPHWIPLRLSADNKTIIQSTRMI